MTPPPMPVPSVIMIRSSTPRPAPTCHSARAAQDASLVTLTVRSSRALSAPAASKSMTPGRCGDDVSTPSIVIEPGNPTPTLATPPTPSPRLVASSTTVATSWSSPRGVGRRSLSTISPSPSITTPRPLVPPTSTPRRWSVKRSGLSASLQFANRVQDPHLGTPLDEAWQRRRQLDDEVVPDERPAFAVRTEVIGTLDRPLDIALDHLPGQRLRRLGVVVLQRVMGAATERRGAELDVPGPLLLVAGPHHDVLDVPGPLRVALDVRGDLPDPLRRRGDRDVLGGGISHGRHSG